ncbi:hypothetical protein IAQ61_012035, partial [Plenodomus lingam]|uniref:uncharacterized protein n=1 Tax=Leptosphaeria maculans TaxID=5022 RepID=UPI00331A446B
MHLTWAHRPATGYGFSGKAGRVVIDDTTQSCSCDATAAAASAGRRRCAVASASLAPSAAKPVAEVVGQFFVVLFQFLLSPCERAITGENIGTPRAAHRSRCLRRLLVRAWARLCVQQRCTGQAGWASRTAAMRDFRSSSGRTAMITTRGGQTASLCLESLVVGVVGCKRGIKVFARRPSGLRPRPDCASYSAADARPTGPRKVQGAKGHFVSSVSREPWAVGKGWWWWVQQQKQEKQQKQQQQQQKQEKQQKQQQQKQAAVACGWAEQDRAGQGRCRTITWQARGEHTQPTEGALLRLSPHQGLRVRQEADITTAREERAPCSNSNSSTSTN